MSERPTTGPQGHRPRPGVKSRVFDATVTAWFRDILGDIWASVDPAVRVRLTEDLIEVRGWTASRRDRRPSPSPAVIDAAISLVIDALDTAARQRQQAITAMVEAGLKALSPENFAQPPQGLGAPDAGK